MVPCDQDLAGLGATCRDNPPELRLQGLGWWGPRWQDLGQPGKGRQPRAGGASGPGAFLGIRLPEKTAAPPSPPAQLPPSPGAGWAFNSLFTAGVSPAAGRRPRPCPLGWHRFFPVSPDHFAIPAPPSAPFSTDRTRWTPGRASFMTSVPADCSLRLWCVPNVSQAQKSGSVHCLLIE